MWPNYSAACRKDVDALLRAGGSLSAYRANPQVGVEPAKGSWAWRLEREIEKRFGFKHAVAVNSGTAGLHCALVGSGITSGEVVTSPFSFSATVAAIIHAGATPVFADVDPHTFAITPETASRVVTKRTRAILPVSIFGGLAEVKGFRDRWPGIPCIEDAAQAVGASSGGSYSGSHAKAAMYSFNGGKQVPAGECGATVTNDSEVALRARLLMNHQENFGNGIGYNYRPNELTCCVAWHGLQEIENRNDRRRALANRVYPAFLRSTFGIEDRRGFIAISSKKFGGIWIPDHFYGDHALYVYPMKVEKNRPIFAKRMRKLGIPCGEGYITPTLNRYPAFRQYQTTPLPVVEELSSKTLCILSTLTPDRPLSYADTVAQAIRESLR